MKDLNRKLELFVTKPLSRVVQGNPKYFMEVKSIMYAMIRQLKAILIKADGPSAFSAVQDLIDVKVKESLEIAKPICKKGCAYCCYMSVDVTVEEAQLALRYAKAKEIDIDWPHVHMQAKVDDYLTLPHPAKRCVFLTAAKECSIYKHRPAACRKYMVGRGSPEQCNSEVNPGGDVDVLVANYAEIYSSVLYSMSESDRFAKKLLEARELENARQTN